jgi:hypothetical protein
MEETMSQLWTNYIIAIVIIISILVIVFMTKISKHKKKCKNIIQSTSPQTVILKDIVVYKRKASKSNLLIIAPVLKNSFTNRVYIPTAMGNYGNLLTPYTFITNKPPKISIINFKNQPVEFTKKGRLFIEEECGKIRVNNKKITIENIEYEYVGKLVNINNFQLSNVNETNILEELDGAILYKGIVDFDEEGFIEEYYK